MAIKVIVELKAKPGRRAELLRVLRGLVATHGASEPGFLGSATYESVDDEDVLVEIADWESAEARAAHMREGAAKGLYAPLLELLAAPFRATVVRMAGIAWTGPPEAGDDERFLAIVDRLVDRLAAAGEAVNVVRIDNWFGRKWLGFAGKVCGALGVHKDTTRADLVVPPFTPGRVVWAHHFALDADGQYVRADAVRALHRAQTSSSNLSRKLAEVSPRAHFVWFSGNSCANGRGSVLVLSLNDEEQDACYLGFTQKQGVWQLNDVAGNPPVPPADLLTEAPRAETLDSSATFPSQE